MNFSFGACIKQFQGKRLGKLGDFDPVFKMNKKI